MATTISATHRYLKMSPRKVRAVAHVVVGKSVSESEDVLLHMNKFAARPILKLIQSASSNAKHVYDLEKDQLFIQHLTAQDGPTLKRFKPRAFGRAAAIRKRMTHLEVTLGLLNPEIEKNLKKRETDSLATPSSIEEATKIQKETSEKNTEESTNSSSERAQPDLKSAEHVTQKVDKPQTKGQGKRLVNKLFNRKTG